MWLRIENKITSRIENGTAEGKEDKSRKRRKILERKAAANNNFLI